jgi:signal transduction histidine kinase
MGARLSTKTVLQWLALTLLFAGLNYIGSAVYHRTGGFTTVKPFCGVALAILLIGGPRVLWPVLITGIIGGVVAKLDVGLTLVDTVLTLGMAVASLLATYFLTRRLIGDAVEFRSWKQLLGFIAIAIAVSAVSALGFAFTGHDMFASTGFVTNFRAWWIPTSLSFVILTPVICLLATVEPGRIYANRVRISGSLVLMGAVLAITFLPTEVPLSFLVPLALLIVTMVSEIEGAALGLVLTQIVYMTVILCGIGPAALRHMPMGLQLHYAQAFLGFLIVVLLPVAAAVTERRKLQEREIEINRALRDSEKRYREMAQREHDASKAKSEFLAAMSHELRTPLNAILGFSEVIQRELYGPLGHPKYREYAEDVHKSGAHLLDLINDVLDLSKIDAGKMELRESSFALCELVSESLLLVRGKARGDVELHVAVPENLMVTADRRLLKQILLNLLSNAIKFTPQGGAVRVATELRAGDGLALSVSDTGIGMNAAEIATAFSHYGQIDSHIARTHQGTGLGLPISKALAGLHGGDLVAESTKGEGTRIILLLPQYRVSRTELAASA